MIQLPPAADLPWTYQSLVFDLDGVLIDTEPIFEEVVHRLLARRNLALIREVAQAVMGTPALQTLEVFRSHYGLAESVAELDAECSTLFWEIHAASPAVLLPGVYPLLERLEQRGVPRAIATSSRRGYVQRILEPYALLDRFDFVLTCEDVRQGKPSPEIYEKAAAQFGHAATEMVVLEDSPNGVRAALAAGARCIAVPHERVPREAISQASAVVPSLAAPELYALLGL